MARDDNREAWPVRLSTEPFVLDGVTFDAVEMDDSFRFYVSFSGGGVESERKLSNSTESDCSLMCVAARKAIATALAANSPH